LSPMVEKRSPMVDKDTSSSSHKSLFKLFSNNSISNSNKVSSPRKSNSTSNSPVRRNALSAGEKELKKKQKKK